MSNNLLGFLPENWHQRENNLCHLPCGQRKGFIEGLPAWRSRCDSGESYTIRLTRPTILRLVLTASGRVSWRVEPAG